MKKGMDIIGLPVFSIAQGCEIGKISRLVIDAEKGSIAALVIDDGKWYRGAKLVPMANVTAIGEFAVTIERLENVIEVADLPDMESLLEQDITVTGTKVLTNKGRILGKVVEIVVDENGKISACEIEEPNNDVMQVPAARILTFGKEVTIVTDKENVETVVTVAPELAKSMEEVSAPPVSASTPKNNQEYTPAPQKENTDESAKKFDDRQRKYLLGKKSTRRIETDNGMVIVDQGGEITEEVLQKAKLAGKFVELSMNIQ